jgi:hypothetical protein
MGDQIMLTPSDRSYTAFGVTLALPGLLLGCGRFGTSDGSTDAGATSCRETFFDSFADDRLADRWDDVVPNNGRFSVDTTVSPPTLVVSRLEGGGGPTLGEHLGPSRDVCCEFGIRGVGDANVFMLTGLGGNYSVFLGSNAGKLTPAEVLSFTQADLSITVS